MRQMNAKNRLGGTGHVTNDSTNHLADRLRKASLLWMSGFAVPCQGYVVMGNHSELVLHRRSPKKTSRNNPGSGLLRKIVERILFLPADCMCCGFSNSHHMTQHVNL